MTTWLLIIYLAGSYTGNIQVIEFSSKKKCLIAKEAIKTFKAKKKYAVCVEK